MIALKQQGSSASRMAQQVRHPLLPPILNLIPGNHVGESRNQLLIHCPLVSTYMFSTQINRRCRNIKHGDVEVSNVQLCTQDKTCEPKVKMWPEHFTQHSICCFFQLVTTGSDKEVIVVKFQSVASKDTPGLGFPYFPIFNQEFCHNIFVKAKL